VSVFEHLPLAGHREMMDNESRELSDDVVFDIMSNRRRRFVLAYLRNEENPAQLTEIATALAAAESDTSPKHVDRRARKRAYVSLYQTHVPRLVEEQAVEYDNDTGEVSLRAPAEEILQHVGRTQSPRRWLRVYIVLGVVGVGLYLLPLAGVAGESLLLAGLLVPLGVLVTSILYWRRLPTQSVWDHEF
jgi:hypothetical protein